MKKLHIIRNADAEFGAIKNSYADFHILLERQYFTMEPYKNQTTPPVCWNKNP